MVVATALPITSLQALSGSFNRSLLATNKSPRTVEVYTSSLASFTAFMVAYGMPTSISHVRREHVEAFIAEQVARHRPATAMTRYASLRAFFKWATEEGEIKETPMVRMKPPAVPVEPVSVLADDDLHRLLKACEGPECEARRDTTIIHGAHRRIPDPSLRLASLAGESA